MARGRGRGPLGGLGKLPTPRDALNIRIDAPNRFRIDAPNIRIDAPNIRIDAPNRFRKDAPNIFVLQKHDIFPEITDSFYICNILLKIFMGGN